ncbi:MAG: amidohydrolase [Azospirillaceae bacterium]|nr:amidohydrolase [Azospirillaceae bacterium]
MSAFVLLGTQAQAAPTLLVNARIHTEDPDHPAATALAWDEAGTLLAVGDTADLVKRYPGAATVDAKGAPVVPGLIDAHGHVQDEGGALLTADLSGANSKAEILRRLKAQATKVAPGDWLEGWGWDQNRWPDKSFPTAADLDAAFPDRPLRLDRVDGHAVWVNSAALRLMAQRPDAKGLDGDWQPEGGRIVRAGAKASGVFIDNAMDLVNEAMPARTDVQIRQDYKLAFAEMVSLGLTGAHEPGISLQSFRVLQDMAAKGEVPVRLYTLADGDHEALDWLCGLGNGGYTDPTARVRMRGVKLYIDGALGSRGARLLRPYSDDPGNSGIYVTDPADYARIVAKAKGCHLQVATHAIGDAGNRTVLDTYAQALGADAKATDHRWRVEHAQIVALEDIPRFGQLGVIASMQPTHATSDMPWAERRLGHDRLAGAYAWQRFVQSGARLALGSDFPVEKVNPFLGLYAAVTRQDLKGQPPGGWLPDQRLTREQALAGFTRDAAYAGFMEGEVGMLKPGLHADFVILSADPLTVAFRRIADIKPRSTWVDGRKVYEAAK